MLYALTPYRRCRTIQARRASRCRCTPMCWLPLTRKDKGMHQVRLQASRPPLRVAVPSPPGGSEGWGAVLPAAWRGRRQGGPSNTAGVAYLKGSFSPLSLTSSYLHTLSHTHTSLLARVMRVTSTNYSPALLSCPEFTFTTSQGTPPNIWTEWPAPVELEYVPAMHAVHAEDPAKSPPRVTRSMRAAVSATHVAAATTSASRHATCPSCRSSLSH